MPHTFLNLLSYSYKSPHDYTQVTMTQPVLVLILGFSLLNTASGYYKSSQNQVTHSMHFATCIPQCNRGPKNISQHNSVSVNPSWMLTRLWSVQENHKKNDHRTVVTTLILTWGRLKAIVPGTTVWWVFTVKMYRWFGEVLTFTCLETRKLKWSLLVKLSIRHMVCICTTINVGLFIDEADVSHHLP